MTKTDWNIYFYGNLILSFVATDTWARGIFLVFAIASLFLGILTQQGIKE